MIDHSNNPKLHALYVRYAYEELRILLSARDELTALSRVTATLAAGVINTEVQKLIAEDTAFRDAASLFITGAKPEPEPDEEGALYDVSEG